MGHHLVTSSLLGLKFPLTDANQINTPLSQIVNPAALRRPAPSHYMIGDPLIRMHEPDPSSLEIEQFSHLIGGQRMEGDEKRFRQMGKYAKVSFV